MPSVYVILGLWVVILSANGICITESWLSDDILNCEIAIPNFNIVRRDRNRNGGGVTVYIKDCFEFKIISHGPLDLEFLALSVHNGNKKIYVCLLYRPPSSSITFLTICILLL